MIVRSLSIIIPAYNEERTIHEVLGVVHALQLPQGIEKEVIVVNDCSKDGTSAAVDRFRTDHPRYTTYAVFRQNDGVYPHKQEENE